jgi:hypothetical protein
MIIDYISDIHEDVFFQDIKSERYGLFIDSFFIDKIIGKVLIIAGDLSENIDRIINFLKKVKEQKGYEYILYIPGNHELYLNSEDKFKSSIEKYNFLYKKVNELNDLGIYFLDGSIIEIEGIKFGGVSMWYDGSYLRKKFIHLEEHSFKSFLNRFYKQYMRDSIKIKESIYEMFYWQEEKLKNIYKDADIIFSHINPMNTDDYLSPNFKGQEGNAFFCFDGLKYLEHTSAKYWIYGHTHDIFEGELFNVKLLCNPSGYPGERNYNGGVIKQFEIF